MKLKLTKLKRVGVGIGAAMLLAVAAGQTTIGAAPAATLGWDASTETNIVGYKIYYGPATRTYTNTIVLGKVTTNTVTGLVNGAAYFFAVTAIDALATESDYSTELTFTLSGVTNSAPVITRPTTLSANKETPTSVAGISISDADAGTGSLTLIIQATYGRIQLLTNVAGGLTPGQVTFNGTSSVQANAPLGAINTTLSRSGGVVYTGGLNFVGNDSIAISLNDNGNTGSGGARSASANTAVAVNGSTFDTWRMQRFAYVDLGDPSKEAALWGDKADPDSDGRDNLMEFALGLNPNTPESADQGIASQLIDVGGSRYFTLSYSRRKNEPLLQYVPEVSSDDQTWNSGSSFIRELSAVDAGAGLETVSCQDLTVVAPGAPRFFRLRVTR